MGGTPVLGLTADVVSSPAFLRFKGWESPNATIAMRSYSDCTDQERTQVFVAADQLCGFLASPKGPHLLLSFMVLGIKPRASHQQLYHYH
jgi:hypothetical protein